jgi:hypothetical protein
MVRQGGRSVLLHRIRRNGLPITSAFRVWTAAMYLQIWVRLLTIQDSTWTLRHVRVDHRLAGLTWHHMRLRIWRVQIGLTLLEMLNLSRRVLRSHEAAVLTPDLVTFGGRI